MLTSYSTYFFVPQVILGVNTHVLIIVTMKLSYFRVRRNELRRLVAQSKEIHRKIVESSSVESHNILRQVFWLG